MPPMTRRRSSGLRRQRKKEWVPPRSRLPRGKLPQQRDSFTGADLCAIAGVTLRALAAWRREGLLPPAPSTRRGARYDRAVARRACAIGLVGVGTARLKRFDEMIPLILDEAPPPVAPAAPDAAGGASPASAGAAASSGPAAPGASAVTAPGSGAGTASPGPPAPARDRAAAPPSAAAPSTAPVDETATATAGALDDEAEIPGQGWRRIELLPGLELHLAEGAAPVLRALVRDIARRFGRSV